jgi:two-component system, LytTR family, sensor kinase
LSSLAIGVALSAQHFLQLGFNARIMTVEFFGGTILGALNWLYHFYLFPQIERKKGRFLAGFAFDGLRIVSAVLLSATLATLLEEIAWIQFGAQLDDNAVFGVINEFRAGFFSLIIALIHSLLISTKQRFDAQIELNNLKAEQTTAQFEMLKHQVNPHFLFNALNILKTMVRNGDPNSEEFIIRMSDLYRYVLSGHQREKITLDEELEALDNYFFMLRARFGDKLTLSLNLKKRDRPCYVPPFTLQILIENCIKHNIVSAQRPLAVEIFCENNHIIVRNNLQKRKAVGESNGFGLQNINQRYRLLAGKEIEIIKSEDYFLVRLPIIDTL